MPSRPLRFTNRHGHQLSAILDQPLRLTPHAYAIFAHCFTCSKNLKAAVHICRTLSAAGIAVLRFDFTGLGDSAGDFADTNFSSSVDDLLDAAEFLRRDYRAPELLIGHSLGGAAALMAASRIDSIKAVATIGAPSEPAHVMRHFAEPQRAAIRRDGLAEVLLEGRPFTVKQQFIEDVENLRLKPVIQQLKAALLICHSPIDETVDICNAGEIFQAARQPKSFLSLDSADHLLTRDEDARRVGRMIAVWAERFLNTAPPRHELDGAHRISVATPGGGYYTEIDIGGHTLIADEPVALGGSGSGPTPYELLCAALGACISITLQMYARHKKLPLADVRVQVTHRKAAARSEAADKPAVDQFICEIELAGELTPEQRQRMLEIAGRCPVHRTLHDTADIILQLQYDSDKN